MQHSEGSFKGLKDFNLYYQKWLPDAAARAVILIAHGYAEHSGRYMNVVNIVLPRGYAVYALDHRGHGRSDGERTAVDSFDDYLVDLKTFFDIVRAENPGRKVFLLGHSMGAAIATGYVLRHQAELAGLVLSGGGITPSDPARAEKSVPRLRRAAVTSPRRSAATPRSSRITATTRLSTRALAPPAPASPLPVSAARCPTSCTRSRYPILIMAGAASPLGDGPRSEALYEDVGSKDKTLKLYKDLMHEIFNEPEHPAVIGDMVDWLEARG